MGRQLESKTKQLTAYLPSISSPCKIVRLSQHYSIYFHFNDKRSWWFVWRQHLFWYVCFSSVFGWRLTIYQTFRITLGKTSCNCSEEENNIGILICKQKKIRPNNPIKNTDVISQKHTAGCCWPFIRTVSELSPGLWYCAMNLLCSIPLICMFYAGRFVLLSELEKFLSIRYHKRIQDLSVPTLGHLTLPFPEWSPYVESVPGMEEATLDKTELLPSWELWWNQGENGVNR